MSDQHRTEKTHLLAHNAGQEDRSPKVSLARLLQHADLDDTTIGSEISNLFTDRDQLDSRLKTWAEHGLLTGEQRYAIEAFARAFLDEQLPTADGADKTVSLPNVDQALEDTVTRYAQTSAEGAGTTKSLEGYEILGEIARGGMGVVYRAHQKKANRAVALKMILSGALAGDDEIQRFYTEAEAAAHLDHPGIVPIYDVGEADGRHYFSMALIEGSSLKDRLAEGPLKPQTAAELVMKVAEAVAFAHSKGIIHRDLKPANILLDRLETPRVTDFGLAKRIQTDNELTATGQVMGTPSYMPPEQAAGKTQLINESADIYSLGAVLYSTLVGRPPFQSASVIDTLLQVIHQEPVPPRQLNPTIDRDLETICLKCLEKQPSRRYESADAVAKDLGRFLNDQPILARPPSISERTNRWAREHVVTVTIIVLFVASSAIWIPLVPLLEPQINTVPTDPLTVNTEMSPPGQVIAEMGRLIKADSSQAGAYYDRAEALYQLGDYLAALQDLNATLSIDPDHVRALQLRGLIFAEADTPDQAIADFSKAITIAPESTATRIRRAEILLEQGDLEAALQDLNVAIELHPGQILAYQLRSKVHSRNGNDPLALLDREQAQRLGGNKDSLTDQTGPVD